MDDEPSDPTAGDTAGPTERPSTAPQGINFAMMGFAEQAEAERLAYAMDHILKVLGQSMDLSGIAGVTVAQDYDAALASIDRGVVGLRPLSRTAGEVIAGVAMSPAVLRDGIVKTHLVFSAPVVAGLLTEDDAMFRSSVAIVAHECGHAVEHTQRDRVLPGVILQHAFTTFEDAFLFMPAEAIWGEYAACHHAADFSNDETEASYREGLAGVLGRARKAVNDAMLAYRSHHNVNRLLSEARNAVAEPLRLAAYLAGHLDGRGRDALAEMQSDLALDRRLAPRIVEAVEAARAMWRTRDQWVGLSVFDALKAAVRSALTDHGIFLHSQTDGEVYVDVAFTPETTPAPDGGGPLSPDL